MAKHGTVRRYTLILEKIGRGNYPTFQEIQDYLFDHGFEISSRTVQRDIEQIRFEFGIEIQYDRSRKGYYIDSEASTPPEQFFRFLEVVNTASLLTESLRESKENLQHIDFEGEGSLKGIENLSTLLFAIKNHRKIVFVHENFVTGKQKKYCLQPYLLKEYLNRWYLVGFVNGIQEFRTFGIDRILSLVVKKETFSPQTQMNPRNLFNNTIGLTYSMHDLEEVIISFTPLQAKYIKALPLHSSQEVISENEKEVQVKLNIIPNFELKQRILMLGENATLLKPEWLAADIRNSLANALKNYD